MLIGCFTLHATNLESGNVDRGFLDMTKPRGVEGGCAHDNHRGVGMNGPLVDDGGSTGDMTPSDKDSQPREHKRKRHTRRLIAVACLCAALILVLVGISIGGRAPLESKLTRDPNVRVGSLTGAGADLDKIVDEGMVSFSINTDPIFSDGKAPGNLTIENLAANNNRFIVTINLKGQGGREVYRSGTIDPGQYIEQAPLSADLPQGDYPAVAVFQTYRLSDNAPLGQVAAELELHVEG